MTSPTLSTAARLTDEELELRRDLTRLGRRLALARQQLDDLSAELRHEDDDARCWSRLAATSVAILLVVAALAYLLLRGGT
jgi:hypothetical protein